MNFIRSYRRTATLLLVYLLAFVSSENNDLHVRKQSETKHHRALLSCAKPCYEFDDNGSLQDAVWTWFHDRKIAEKLFGHISCWGVSKVTSMSELFSFKMNDAAVSFNEEISCWDVSRVTDMSQMFRGAKKFNSDISYWEVDKVKNMDYVFWDAASFNAKIQHWDTSGVTSMKGKNDINVYHRPTLKCLFWRLGMFEKAKSFNRCVAERNVFCESNWDVSRVKDLRWIFSGATSFKQSLCWDLDGKKTDNMFRDSQGCIKADCCKSCDKTLLCK